MKYTDQITEIFVNVDNFYSQFKKEIKKHQLSTTKKQRNRKFTMSASEVMSIMILFHLSNQKNIKHFD